LQRLATGEGFIQLSGEDGTALAFNAHGGTGCISVTANVAPRLCAEFQEATLAGDYAKALTLQDRLMPLHKALFCETSPGPVKYAVSLLGHAPEELRCRWYRPPMRASAGQGGHGARRSAQLAPGTLRSA
jgi:4-hydroxy-tetrahydrodipicolinate synthase